MSEWLPWILAGINLAGVIGSWLVSSRASARRDGSVDAQLMRHGSDIQELQSASRDHGEDISMLKGHLGIGESAALRGR